MNGRFFKFSSAYATTSRRNILPVAPLFNSSAKRYRRAGIPAMAARLAPKVRVPATIGRRCTADMVGRRRDERVDSWLRRTQIIKGGMRAWCMVLLGYYSQASCLALVSLVDTLAQPRALKGARG